MGWIIGPAVLVTLVLLVGVTIVVKIRRYRKFDEGPRGGSFCGGGGRR